jgi:hypothetical protein
VYTSTTRCWRTSDATGSPFGTGERFVFNDGNATFAPLVRSGSATTVALTYEWSPGATATETDVFASTHPAPVRITIAIRGARSLTVHKTITPLAQAVTSRGDFGTDGCAERCTTRALGRRCPHCRIAWYMRRDPCTHAGSRFSLYIRVTRRFSSSRAARVQRKRNLQSAACFGPESR